MVSLTKFLNISTDTSLGGNSPSDETVSSQKALKTYIDNHSGGSVAIDNLSITKNGSDEIQAVGVIDQASSSRAIKIWTGTKAQYDLIVSKDANTVYNITDDTNPTQALLESIYPVGSVYIGTMSICPLSSLFGTWTKIATKILTDATSTAPVKGNGMALGLTDGTTNAGLLFNSGGTLQPYTGNYGSNVGIANSGSYIASIKSGGVTTDATKSGLEAVITTSSITVNVWTRTA